MDNKISILFYSRIAKKTKENLIPVYLRITVDGKRIDHSINRTLELSKWSKAAGKMKGSHSEARAFNSYLDALKHKVHALERQMVHDGYPLLTRTLKTGGLAFMKSHTCF